MAPVTGRDKSSRFVNPAELRGAINRGETGDKRAMGDPAAAPLGTDEEAGGTPPSPQQAAVELAQGKEIGRVAGGDDRAAASRTIWISALVAALVLAVLLTAIGW